MCDRLFHKNQRHLATRNALWSILNFDVKESATLYFKMSLKLNDICFMILQY